MIVAEWKAEPSRMGTPVIHTHLMLLQIAIRMIANLAFDPSLPAMVYIEKRTVRTTLKVGGTFFQVHIAIHHKSAIKNFVDCGKQKELLKRCPLYADMWKAHIGAKNWSVSEKKEVAAHV